MPKPQAKQLAQAQTLLDLVAQINPYNRQGINDRALYDIYTAGFLAAYLASLMAEDPWIYKRFLKHINTGNDRKN